LIAGIFAIDWTDIQPWCTFALAPDAIGARSEKHHVQTHGRAISALNLRASEYAVGVLSVVVAAVSFGLLGTLSGLAYQGGMGSATFTAVRAFVGAAILALFVISGGEACVDLRRLARREQAMLAAAVVANATLNLVLFAAYGVMSVAVVLAIYFTYPLLVALASVVLRRERFTPARLAGLALALVGVALVLGGQIGPGAQVSLVGLACAAVAALCQATYLVVSRSGYTRVPPAQATGLILAGGGLLAGIVALGADLPSGHLLGWVSSPQAWIAVLLAGSVGAALAKVCLLRGVRRIGGTRTAVLMLGEPMVGALAAALVLGQRLTPAAVAGGAAILVAAALVQRPSMTTSPARHVRPAVREAHPRRAYCSRP
jgi:drug/metabolite transporter (DMT)-like permease